MVYNLYIVFMTVQVHLCLYATHTVEMKSTEVQTSPIAMQLQHLQRHLITAIAARAAILVPSSIHAGSMQHNIIFSDNNKFTFVSARSLACSLQFNN